MVAGLAMGADYYEAMRRDYADKRAVLCDALDRAGLTPFVPAGAYYVLADVRRLGHATSRDACHALLERVGVASVPGTSFYADPVGETLARFCFAKELDVLHEAARRLVRL